jgi:hypothetical protein
MKAPGGITNIPIGLNASPNKLLFRKVPAPNISLTAPRSVIPIVNPTPVPKPSIIEGIIGFL